MLVYRLTYTSCSYRFWFHLFCFSYSHGLVMLVLCIMFLLLHTSAYSCFLWHSLVYSIVPCCHILKWGVAFVSFFGLAILGALPLAWTFNVLPSFARTSAVFSCHLFDLNFLNEVPTLSFSAAKLVQATLLQVPDALFSELFQKLFRLILIHKTFFAWGWNNLIIPCFSCFPCQLWGHRKK